MKIALFPNPQKKSSKSLAKGIIKFLQNNGVHVVIKDESAKELDADPLSSLDPGEIDFLISMGGDGTILNLVHKYPKLHAPILGINLGSLGFLADVPIAQVYPALQDLIDGNYTVESRIMMDGKTSGNQACFAVNEIVIHRSQNPSLVDLVIHVDGKYLNTFSADGMIISTPTGSTAYSLAAGGPILSPELNAFVITPISPHTISNRPIVLMPKNNIKIQSLSSPNPVEVNFDGIAKSNLQTGDLLHITKSPRTFQTINLPNHDYFLTLRTKLHWSGKIRP
jgi:NAD+ kinase